MRVVGYSKKMSFILRYSNVPLKEQNDRIRTYVASKGWTMSGFYNDKSDDNDSDSGFKKLETDGINRQFDVVVIDSIYRCGVNVSFARELLLNVFYLAGIHFAIVEDDICSMDMTEEQVKKYFISVRQRANSLIKMDKALLKLKSTGELSSDKECYGYLLSDDRKELIIDEEAAYVIRLIFSMYSDGKSTGEICKYLNDNQVDTPVIHLRKVSVNKSAVGGTEWKKGHLARIRKNIRYTGITENLGYRELTYPKMIDKDIFDKVNKMHEGRKPDADTRNRFDFDNIFAGKVFLAPSEEKLACHFIEKKDGYYFRRRTGTKTIVAYSDIESEVIRALKTEKSQTERIKAIIESSAGKEFMESIKQSYLENANNYAIQIDSIIMKKLYGYKLHELKQISDDEYIESIKKYDNEISEIDSNLSALLKDFYSKSMLLSENNPWIIKYDGYDDHTALTIKSVKNLINKIIVYEDGQIDVKLFTEGKNHLPVCWRCAVG